jgi:hypothetical protein
MEHPFEPKDDVLIDQMIMPHPGDLALSEAKGTFDAGLTEELALLLRGMSVGVNGYANGLYIRQLRARGLECQLFDQENKHLNKATNEQPRMPEAVKVSRSGKEYGATLCLGVGEQLLANNQYEFLDSLAKHSREMIVLSWSVKGRSEEGFENPHSNSFVIYQLWKRGFQINARTTLLVRTHCSLDWLKSGLMVFSRSRVPRALAERRAMKRIIDGDIQRLQLNNRSNSPWHIAAVGKAARIVSLVQRSATKAANRLRVLSYDATRTNRPPRIEMSVRARGEMQFFPVCFTCGKHFKFVRLALLSLDRSRAPISRVYIFMDKGDPLSDAECEQLRAESRYPITFRLTKFPMSSWGPKVQLSELGAYREIVKQMSDSDMLVKFDSDVLFISSEIFQFVTRSMAGAVGTHVSKLHASEGQEEYMQGGCYFIGAKELRAIVDIPIATTALAPTKWGEIPEDQFFSRLLARCGVKPVYNDFLYFDPVFIASGSEDRQLDASVKAIPVTAGVLHFEGNQWDKVDRSNMKRVAERLFGPLPPVLNPYHLASSRRDSLASRDERIPASPTE